MCIASRVSAEEHISDGCFEQICFVNFKCQAVTRRTHTSNGLSFSRNTAKFCCENPPHHSPVSKADGRKFAFALTNNNKLVSCIRFFGNWSKVQSTPSMNFRSKTASRCGQLLDPCSARCVHVQIWCTMQCTLQSLYYGSQLPNCKIGEACFFFRAVFHACSTYDSVETVKNQFGQVSEIVDLSLYLTRGDGMGAHFMMCDAAKYAGTHCVCFPTQKTSKRRGQATATAGRKFACLPWLDVSSECFCRAGELQLCDMIGCESCSKGACCLRCENVAHKAHSAEPCVARLRFFQGSIVRKKSLGASNWYFG